MTSGEQARRDLDSVAGALSRPTRCTVPKVSATGDGELAEVIIREAHQGGRYADSVLAAALAQLLMRRFRMSFSPRCCRAGVGLLASRAGAPRGQS